MRFAYIIEPPFNHIDDTGMVAGHDVEIARHVYTELGESFEPVETTFADLLPGLARGDWSMATGMFATPEREQLARFSTPIWALGDGLLVAKGNPMGLQSYADCAQAGARLAVLVGQDQRRFAEAAGATAQQFVEFDDYSEAAEAVIAGTADAYASVYEAHTGYIAQNPNAPVSAIAIPEQEKPPSFGSFSVARNAEELLVQVNAVLADYIGSAAHLELAAQFGFTADQIARVRA